MLAAFEAAKSLMDSRGMLPSSFVCKGCKKPLNADGNRPAELYLGTYTGLCYTCEKSGPYLARTYTLDGAQVWSHPPHCPSWRRDREEFKAYADCTACEGKGVAGHEYSWGSTLYKGCEACSSRYYRHPMRAKLDAFHTKLYRAAESVWQSELDRIARSMLPAKPKPKKKAVAAVKQTLYQSPRVAALKAEVLARHNKARAKLDALTATVYATAP